MKDNSFLIKRTGKKVETSLKNFSSKRSVLEKILINEWELNTQDGMMANAIEKFAKEHIEWSEELDKTFWKLQNLY